MTVNCDDDPLDLVGVVVFVNVDQLLRIMAADGDIEVSCARDYVLRDGKHHRSASLASHVLH